MLIPTFALLRATKIGALVATGALMTACGMSSMDHSAKPDNSMSGHAMTTGDGLSAESGGFKLVGDATALPAGKPSTFDFRILDSNGKAVTTFEPDQTKLMHFYVVRSDLTGFQHVHPAMAPDGTWAASLSALEPGSHRVYASFVATPNTMPVVLSQSVKVEGASAITPVPPASTTTTVDGYTLTLDADRVMAGMSHDLAVTLWRDGKPVTDLQPYLDTYAHLTAFHEGDLAIAHLHPHVEVSGEGGGPNLSFEANLPRPGPWRLFIQFQTGGQLHTAAVTVNAT